MKLSSSPNPRERNQVFWVKKCFYLVLKNKTSMFLLERIIFTFRSFLHTTWRQNFALAILIFSTSIGSASGSKNFVARLSVPIAKVKKSEGYRVNVTLVGSSLDKEIDVIVRSRRLSGKVISSKSVKLKPEQIKRIEYDFQWGWINFEFEIRGPVLDDNVLSSIVSLTQWSPNGFQRIQVSPPTQSKVVNDHFYSYIPQSDTSQSQHLIAISNPSLKEIEAEIRIAPLDNDPFIYRGYVLPPLSTLTFGVGLNKSSPKQTIKLAESFKDSILSIQVKNPSKSPVGMLGWSIYERGGRKQTLINERGSVHLSTQRSLNQKRKGLVRLSDQQSLFCPWIPIGQRLRAHLGLLEYQGVVENDSKEKSQSLMAINSDEKNGAIISLPSTVKSKMGNTYFFDIQKTLKFPFEKESPNFSVARFTKFPFESFYLWADIIGFGVLQIPCETSKTWKSAKKALFDTLGIGKDKLKLLFWNLSQNPIALKLTWNDEGPKQSQTINIPAEKLQIVSPPKRPSKSLQQILVEGELSQIRSIVLAIDSNPINLEVISPQLMY